jgi:hypothetical protein
MKMCGRQATRSLAYTKLPKIPNICSILKMANAMFAETSDTCNFRRVSLPEAEVLNWTPAAKI